MENLGQVTAAEFFKQFNENINLLDVRRQSEYDSEHIIGAINFPLDFIYRKINELDWDKKYFLYCAGGFRSIIAASILKSRGFDQLVNIKGGYEEMCKTDLKRTDYVEQVTEL